MKLLYQEIRAKLESDTSVQHVRLWNNQTEFIEEGQQIPFPFPACFIEFPTIQWRTLGKGTQISDELLVRVYVCFESYNTTEQEEDVAVFDLRDEVFLALQDFKTTGGGKLNRIAEQTDTRHTNVYVWVMDFTTSYQDKTAQFPRGGTTAEINTLTLNKDLIIDAGTVDGIRTAKDFPE